MLYDPRIKKLADMLVGYSCKVQSGERVLIQTVDIPVEMITALIDRIVEVGGIPFFQTGLPRVSRSLYTHATLEQLLVLARRDIEFLKEMQCCIMIVGEENSSEISDVPGCKMQMIVEHLAKPVLDYREKHTRWVAARWPTPSMAQLAGMSTEAFEDFYFDVCTLDYEKMAQSGKPFTERMSRAEMVHIKDTLDTDISFCIKGMPARVSAGERNIPDGELYTAPIKDSANGVIHYNTGTIYNGRLFDDIRLVFKNGKIIDATSSNTSALNDILDTDEGARYIGEFALGINPHIHQVMRDSIFDEKIAGSLHFTPGLALTETDNGNRSSIHWDMVMIQTPAFGGGEIWFDDELIRKNGRFVPDYLDCLNPENLI